MLLSLTSIYKDTDPENHPEIFVMFNNVSKFDNQKDLDPEYNNPESAGKLDKEITMEQCINTFKEELIEELITNYDGMDLDFITKRVDQLLPVENFFCYKKRKGSFKEMEPEWQEPERLVKDLLKAPSLYMECGILEPQYLTVKENKTFIGGLDRIMSECNHAINSSLKVYTERT